VSADAGGSKRTIVWFILSYPSRLFPPMSVPSPFQSEVFKSAFADEMYDIRLLVMVELLPQSDRYVQFKMTKEQYQKLLDLLHSFIPPDKEEDSFNVPITDDDAVVISNRNDWHEFDPNDIEMIDPEDVD